MPMANKTENKIWVYRVACSIKKKQSGTVHTATHTVFKLSADTIFLSAIRPKSIRHGMFIIPFRCKDKKMPLIC